MLLGGAVSSVVIAWCYDAKKLVQQVACNTGENASYLPFLWEYMIKFITPLILFVLFFYKVHTRTHTHTHTAECLLTHHTFISLSLSLPSSSWRICAFPLGEGRTQHGRFSYSGESLRDGKIG